jgi:hypothetical protein
MRDAQTRHSYGWKTVQLGWAAAREAAALALAGLGKCEGRDRVYQVTLHSVAVGVVLDSQ